MELVNNNNMFTDLTEEETNSLNGGARCYYAYVRRCVRRGFRIVCAWAYVVRCY